MRFSPAEEQTFIGSCLGPPLAAAGFGNVQILDNSWASYAYAASVLGGAAQYTAGAAYHGYVGSPSDMKTVQSAYPHAGQHVTEFRSLTSQTRNFQMAPMAGGYTAQSVAAGAQPPGAVRAGRTFRIVDDRTSRGTKVTMAPGELSTFTWPIGQ
jgi:hypothetical protein